MIPFFNSWLLFKIRYIIVLLYYWNKWYKIHKGSNNFYIIFNNILWHLQNKKSLFSFILLFKNFVDKRMHKIKQNSEIMSWFCIVELHSCAMRRLHQNDYSFSFDPVFFNKHLCFGHFYFSCKIICIVVIFWNLYIYLNYE